MDATGASLDGAQRQGDTQNVPGVTKLERLSSRKAADLTPDISTTNHVVTLLDLFTVDPSNQQ